MVHKEDQIEMYTEVTSAVEDLLLEEEVVTVEILEIHLPNVDVHHLVGVYHHRGVVLLRDEWVEWVDLHQEGIGVDRHWDVEVDHHLEVDVIDHPSAEVDEIDLRLDLVLCLDDGPRLPLIQEVDAVGVILQTLQRVGVGAGTELKALAPAEAEVQPAVRNRISVDHSQSHLFNSQSNCMKCLPELIQNNYTTFLHDQRRTNQ